MRIYHNGKKGKVFVDTRASRLKYTRQRKSLMCYMFSPFKIQHILKSTGSNAILLSVLRSIGIKTNT